MSSAPFSILYKQAQHQVQYIYTQMQIVLHHTIILCISSSHVHADDDLTSPSWDAQPRLLMLACRYQLLQIDTPKKVTFFGVSRFHESTDTVMFQQKPGAKDIVIVDYNTDIELVGWYR